MYITLMTTSLLVLPVVGFVLALKSADFLSIAFLWNITFFCNSVYLFLFLLDNIYIPAVKFIINP